MHYLYSSSSPSAHSALSLTPLTTQQGVLTLMPSGIYTFPEGFLWGTATAAHQVEGRNTNDTWYAWEQETGRIIDGATAAV
ncbi:MAG: family 1 glycosylhydrolase, partial [Methanomethylovorans sp.]|nr:family 1 glycosylhydrolase [Methanomethylovorans sp.]